MIDDSPASMPDDGTPSASFIPHQAVKASPRVTVGTIARAELRPLNARLVKEQARTLLARTFALSFLITLCASFAGAIFKWEPVKDWLQVVLPAETALFGSALGFYFGSNTDAD